ncbi:MAG: hypothetical protein K0S39_2157 [Paenibacillus sp.]|jgi:hypothetical protein|nr:hypothetical protein [Paenibacillus sp.]
MFVRCVGKKGTIWFWGLGIVLVPALFQQHVYPCKAEAALLDVITDGKKGTNDDSAQNSGKDSKPSDSPKAVSELKENLTSAVSKLPALSNDLPGGGKEKAPPSKSGEDTNKSSMPVQASNPTEEKTPANQPVSGIQVKSTSVVQETPVIKTPTPGSQTEAPLEAAPVSRTLVQTITQTITQTPAQTPAPTASPSPNLNQSKGMDSRNHPSPALQVKTPSISVDVPLLKIEIPSASEEVKLPKEAATNASVSLPFIPVDMPAVQVKIQAVQAAVPLTPTQALEIKAEIPNNQVKTPIVDIYIPGTPVSLQLDSLEHPPIKGGEGDGNEPGEAETPPLQGGDKGDGAQPSRPEIPSVPGGSTGGDSTKEPVTVSDGTGGTVGSAQPDGTNDRRPVANRTVKSAASNTPSGEDVTVGTDTTSVSTAPAKAAPVNAGPTGLISAVDYPKGFPAASTMIGAHDFFAAVPIPDYVPSSSVPVRRGVAEPQTGTDIQYSMSESIPSEPAASASSWLAPPAILTGSASMGGSTSSGGGSGTLTGSPGLLFPVMVLQPPRIMNQNYERSQRFGSNQWSKPPPGQPPRYTFFSS